MEKYVLQLLEQIKNAHRPVCVDQRTPHVISFEEEMETVEKWATGVDRPPSLGYKCGLTQEQFPPPEKLTAKQMETIAEAFRKMLATWNLQVEFPSNLPMERAYPLLITILEEEAWCLPGGSLVFDFCSGYAPDCVMKEYCACLKFWNKQ